MNPDRAVALPSISQLTNRPRSASEFLTPMQYCHSVDRRFQGECVCRAHCTCVGLTGTKFAHITSGTPENAPHEWCPLPPRNPLSWADALDRGPTHPMEHLICIQIRDLVPSKSVTRQTSCCIVPGGLTTLRRCDTSVIDPGFEAGCFMINREPVRSHRRKNCHWATNLIPRIS